MFQIYANRRYVLLTTIYIYIFIHIYIYYSTSISSQGPATPPGSFEYLTIASTAAFGILGSLLMILIVAYFWSMYVYVCMRMYSLAQLRLSTQLMFMILESLWIAIKS